MKEARTQLGIRKNTASSRRQVSHPTVDSLPSMSEPQLRASQHRHISPIGGFPAISRDESITSIPLGAARREVWGDHSDTFSAPTTLFTSTELRHVQETPEPFVSSDQAARFLCVKRRYLLELARRGLGGAYAVGTGGKRKIWVFRLSEVAASVVRNETSIPKPQKPCTIPSGSPR